MTDTAHKKPLLLILKGSLVEIKGSREENPQERKWLQII